MRLDTLIRGGAIFSSAGIVLIVLLISVLLIFPVVKNCPIEERCEYYSTAPEPLKYIITPVFIAAALFVIAAGVGLMRFARWYKFRD